jgi:membrane protein YdbS with pleckstrin-like domain
MGSYSHKTEQTMKGNGHSRMRLWMLLVPVGVIGLVVHSVVLYYVFSHTALSAAVMSGVIVLIVIKHLGLLGPLYALFRRRARR